jgi:hypothetical protein
MYLRLRDINKIIQEQIGNINYQHKTVNINNSQYAEVQKNHVHTYAYQFPLTSISTLIPSSHS